MVVHGCRQGCGQFQVISRHMAADDVPKLRRYCAENFAASVVSVDSPERTSAALAEVVWLATLDHAKAVTSHRRSARVVLAKLHIPTAGVKGWLVLEADEAVRVAAAQHRVDRPMQLRHQAQSRIESRAPRAASSGVADGAVLQGTRASREAARAGDTTPRCNEGVDEDPDVKVIVLVNSHRGGAASSFCFENDLEPGSFPNRYLAAQ